MATYPVFEMKEYSIGTDPTGSRDQDSGGGFVKFLTTGAGGSLDFDPINVTTSGGITESHVVLGRVDSFGDASGVFNMKFFLTSTSAWGAGTYRFLQRISTSFLTDYQVSEADGDTSVTIPGVNLLPATEEHAIKGLGDTEATQFIYLGVLAKEDVPVGIKGGAGLGTFRYRLLYDFS